MDALIKPIEQALMPVFKGLPSLPENGKKGLVNAWPWIALVFGVLQLFAVYGLWNLGHSVNTLVDYTNQLSIASGYGPVTPQLGFFYYLGLASLLVDAIILLAAFSPLKTTSKKGWDLLFLGAIVNLIYGVIILFDGQYGGFGNFISAVIGSAIAFYFLYQVRDYYSGTKKPVVAHTSSPGSGSASGTSTNSTADKKS
jgi:Na+/H+-translocating membrane pyrophosphatase